MERKPSGLEQWAYMYHIHGSVLKISNLSCQNKKINIALQRAVNKDFFFHKEKMSFIMNKEKNTFHCAFILNKVFVEKKNKTTSQLAHSSQLCFKQLAQRRFRSSCASALADQSHRRPPEDHLNRVSWEDFTSRKHAYIMLTLKPHFYIVKVGFTGVYIIFLISVQKHRL